jgi:[acyl-carrier-protein] S-malonyltransferase
MEGGVVPDMLAGFSLGELVALAVSGAVTEEEGLRLVIRRAELMQEAAERSRAAMAAVIKLDNETVARLCAEFDKVYPVNFNSPGQVVVSGAVEEMEDFKSRVKEAGGRCLPLKVGGGFHSPFMLPAAEGFGAALEAFPVGTPKIPVYSNATALPYEGGVKTLLTRQIVSPVLWSRTVENMAAAGADTFIECGPGRVLSGLITRITDKARVFNVEDEESLKKTLSEVLMC